MDPPNKNNRANRIHPLEAHMESQISEYSGYIALLEGLLCKHDEAHDKAIEVAIEELTHRIYRLKRKLKTNGLRWPSNL